MTWAKDWKELGGKWDSQAAAEKAADGVKARLGQPDGGFGILKDVEVTQHEPKPESDPGLLRMVRARHVRDGRRCRDQAVVDEARSGLTISDGAHRRCGLRSPGAGIGNGRFRHAR